MEQPGRREGLERRRSKGPCDSQHPQQPWANVECIAFSPDGKLLPAANWNGDVLVWATGSWKSPPSILTCYSNVA